MLFVLVSFKCVKNWQIIFCEEKQKNTQINQVYSRFKERKLPLNSFI